MPPTVLTECVAQVGAILILSKPENRGRLILFGGIEQVRFRRPVYAGDVVEIEARVKRLRSRMGVFEGLARVNGRTVANGTMTFALGPLAEARDNHVRVSNTSSMVSRTVGSGSLWKSLRRNCVRARPP